MLQLNRASNTPLFEQLYSSLREHIANGAFPEGNALPSIRELAQQLSCSKNTVDKAYQMLIRDDVVAVHQGSRFVVKAGSAKQLRRLSNVGAGALTPKQQAVAAALEAARGPAIRYDFTYGDLQVGTFPTRAWKAILDEIFLEPDATGLTSYEASSGIDGLRKEIAKLLLKERGITCAPEQIIVQSGTSASLMNLLQLFDAREDRIAMDEPGYSGARQVFRRLGFELVPCPTWVTDGSGQYLKAVRSSNAKLMYTTPSCQFPTGRTMPPEVRQALLAWARETGAYIIEDDYCWEYRYTTEPVPALFAAGADAGSAGATGGAGATPESNRVIYMGTFSKALSPALRMNYLVLPPELVTRWNEVFADEYPFTPWITQETLRRFLAGDGWTKHKRRMQGLGRRKYHALTEAIERHMGDRVSVIEGGAGLHLLLSVPGNRNQKELARAAAARGVRVYETDKYWMTENHPMQNCVLVGFSAIDAADIEPGIKALSEAWFGESACAGAKP